MMTLEPGLFDKNYPILITNAHSSDGKKDIFIDDTGFIRDIGEKIAKKYETEVAFSIDAEGMAVLPGFVNLHTHAAMTLLRGYADDIAFNQWLYEKILPIEAVMTPDDVYRGTRLACLEMIRSGTTTFLDMYFFERDVARAVRDMNMRAVLSFLYTDFGDSEIIDQRKKEAEEYVHTVKSWNQNLIKPGIGPHAVYSVTPQSMEWCREFSQQHQVPIHIHMSETEKEVVECQKNHQTTPTGLLHKHGLLTPETVAAHCCWISEGDCMILGKEGTHVAHNPVSNQKLTVGKTMPYHWLKCAKVNVGLGTDGCASNNNLDMMETMRIAAMIQRVSWNDCKLLQPRELITLATQAGSRALGLPTVDLQIGCPADLILLKSSGCFPGKNGLSPEQMLTRSSETRVDTTICNGRLLMLHEFIPGEVEIMDEASHAAEQLVRRANQ
jgi:5-methylthioadenosine/S-adenosylhomocysteine deaminase